jgi:hypothetical protein
MPGAEDACLAFDLVSEEINRRNQASHDLPDAQPNPKIYFLWCYSLLKDASTANGPVGDWKGITKLNPEGE